MTGVVRGTLLFVAGACLALPTPAGAGEVTATPIHGLGAWVDRYDAAAWRHPERTVRLLDRHGVGTLFLQTSNYALPNDLPRGGSVGRFVDAAHRRGLRVVGWYAPSLCRLRRDKRRALAAISFRSPSGGRFDGFGLDIESACVRPPARRNSRLLRLSRRIRRAAGPRYWLGAIVPSPYGMRLRGRSYWPDFPFAALRRHYDGYLLMTYFTYRARGRDSVRAFTAKDISVLRAAVNDPTVPVHSIGGEAQRATQRDVSGFAAAIRAGHVDGASLYDAAGTTDRMWSILRRSVSPPGAVDHGIRKAAAPSHTGLRATHGENSGTTSALLDAATVHPTSWPDATQTASESPWPTLPWNPFDRPIGSVLTHATVPGVMP